MFTATYPQYSLYMLPERIDVARFIINHPQEMAAKVAAAWTEYRQDAQSEQHGRHNQGLSNTGWHPPPGAGAC